MSQAAIEHLEDAEAAIMSFIGQLGDEERVDEPDALPMLLAVLRHVSRAAGILHGQTMFQSTLLSHPPDPRWRCWRGYPPYCSQADPNVHEPGFGCGIGSLI